MPRPAIGGRPARPERAADQQAMEASTRPESAAAATRRTTTRKPPPTRQTQETSVNRPLKPRRPSGAGASRRAAPEARPAGSERTETPPPAKGVRRAARPAADAAKAPAAPPRLPAPAIPRGRPTRAPAQRRLRHLSAEVEHTLIHAVERPSRRRGADAVERAVVLIHGAGVDHRDWTFDFIHRIDPSWRVLAFDRPGFGASGRPRSAASALPTTQARLLRAAAASFGVRETIVVGHSWGGAVAMGWGLADPESTLGVASLAGAVAPWSLANAIKNGRRMQSAARTAFGPGGLREAALEALRESFEPDPVPGGYAEHMATDLSPLSGPTAATIADVSTINGALALMTPNYPRLERPVELLYSDADPILSLEEQGEAAAALLPQARLTILKGAGHMIHHSRAKTCLEALQRLIDAARRS